jgi:four helix bundle protein
MKSVKKQDQDIEQRTFLFAVGVIKIVDCLPKTIVANELAKQIVRSGTSVNSNIVQARAAVSRLDFINHMKIARKEAKETKRWIEMLVASGLVAEQKVRPCLEENEEIISRA